MSTMHDIMYRGEFVILRIFVEIKKSGSVLLSHDLTIIVSSALKGLTSVFGMGTGVSPSVSPPETYASITLA